MAVYALFMIHALWQLASRKLHNVVFLIILLFRELPRAMPRGFVYDVPCIKHMECSLTLDQFHRLLCHIEMFFSHRVQVQMKVFVARLLSSSSQHYDREHLARETVAVYIPA